MTLGDALNIVDNLKMHNRVVIKFEHLEEDEAALKAMFLERFCTKRAKVMNWRLNALCDDEHQMLGRVATYLNEQFASQRPEIVAQWNDDGLCFLTSEAWKNRNWFTVEGDVIKLLPGFQNLLLENQIDAPSLLEKIKDFLTNKKLNPSNVTVDMSFIKSGEEAAYYIKGISGITYDLAKSMVGCCFNFTHASLEAKQTVRDQWGNVTGEDYIIQAEAKFGAVSIEDESTWCLVKIL